MALDASVLVRYLVNDDVEQAEVARALLEGLTTEELRGRSRSAASAGPDDEGVR